MINKKAFENIRKDLADFENTREKIIQQSRDIISFSKKIIYGVQRKEHSAAKAYLTEIRKKVKALPREAYDTDIQRVALQEYVEAICFYDVIVEQKLPTKDEIGVDTESYLMGLSDLTGELVREAVNAAILGDDKKSLMIKDFVLELYGEFLKLDLRNGELRKRGDAIKWNLRKLEDLTLSLKMKNSQSL